MRKSLFVFSITAFLLFVLSTTGLSNVEVNIHDNWEFKQNGKDTWFPARVPGIVHLDLLENEIIDDPYWEDNEIKQRWIENESWTYRTTFLIDEELLTNKHVELQFDGLDTYAEVFLNGESIITANNMFRSWKADVRTLLHEGENELVVEFQSPVEYNKDRVRNYPHKLPSGNEEKDIPVKVGAFTRKAAYQFGWDWGPRFVSVGIYLPVKLVAWNEARIFNVYTTTETIEEDVAVLNTHMEVEITESAEYDFRFGSETRKQHLEAGVHQISHQFEVENPKLWWTHDLGTPHRYDQVVQVYAEENLLDEASNNFGIRTMELVHELDDIGTSFYFKLNGVAHFMKGANYIPQDVFLPRVRDEQYEELIIAAKEAGMNMIRVWGGGVYEKDIFYNLCDQHGILVWQDFMFAGSLYPNDEDFRENVKVEVVEVIKRLRSHPCLAIWCGNNEIEVAWKNWGWQKQYGYSSKDSIEIWDNYDLLFHQLIPELVKKHHPELAYTPTSPLSNWGTAENFNHSTMHYWGVWHGREPFEAFEDNVGRFMVEYGFQSFPSMSTLRKVIAEENLYWDSEALTHRQKSYIGNGMIMKHIKQYFDEPESFEDFVERSQEVQAMGMEMAVQSHMEKQPHCMGSLFWQLNDCWPGPSWSVIDYFGNKKRAYFSVQRAFKEE